MTRRGNALAVMVGAMALSACGGGGGAGDSEPEGFGPLAELMGWEPEEPAEQRRKELKAEELAAECMRQEGFEYEPVDYQSQMPQQSEEDALLASTDPEAFGAKYGYGVVYYYELYDEPGLRSGDGPGAMTQEFEDPNQDYVESLSESEMQDYYATLDGDPEIWEQPEDETGSSEVFVAPPLEEQGCRGKARLEVYGENPAESDPEFQQRMNDFWEDSQNDPRIEAANADWVECMGDELEGIELIDGPITTPAEMYSYVDQLKMEAEGLEAEPYDESDPDAYSDDVYMVSSNDNDPDTPATAWVGKPALIPEDELESLRAKEIALWKHDHECQEKTDITKVQREIEQELVDELTADFPDLVNAAKDDDGS